jgi:hypothetical protein
LPRLFVDYDPAVGPLIRLALIARMHDGTWGPRTEIEAVVDSGATRSSVRVEDLDDLNVAQADRAPGPQITFANGATEGSTRLLQPLAAKLVDPSTGAYWGPTFQLSPTAKASGDRLLGTADFFEVFEVAFWPAADQSRFSLVS